MCIKKREKTNNVILYFDNFQSSLSSFFKMFSNTMNNDRGLLLLLL